MKKLHLVGFTRDIDGLILSPRKGAKTGGFVVALDDELLASIQDARHRQEHGDDPVEGSPAPPAAPSRTRPTSALSPREIQSRLRAGSTIAEVAAQAGVGEEWVLRFADPILAEQGRVVESAQKLTFAKSRLGPSIEPLAESVQWNLTDRGVRFSDDVFANGWSAYNLHGARWAVRFTYSSRKRRQTAEWEVDLRERSLSARNRLASDLGHVEAGRRRPRLEPVEHGPAEGEAAQPPVVDGRGGLRQAKKARKAAPRPPGRKGAAKTTPAKTTPAKGTAAGTRGAGAKRSAAAKNPAGATRAAAAANTSAANQAPGRTSPRRKVSTARSAAGATATAVAAKKSGREPSPRKARAGKKPSSDAPAAAPATKALTAPEPLPERPSHLARPPSPMNSANKATSLPGRRLTSQFARPGAPAPAARPPAPSAPSAPSGVKAPAAEESSARAPSAPPAPPEPQPEPASPAPVEAARPSAGPGERSGGEAPSSTSTDRPAASSAPPPTPPPPTPPPKSGRADAGRAKAPAARPATGRAAARVVAPPLPRPVPLQGNGDDERPAVVILSTPPSAPGPAATGRARIDAGRAGESGGESKAGTGGVPRDPGTARPRRRG